jgi:hypothetical protein
VSDLWKHLIFERAVNVEVLELFVRLLNFKLDHDYHHFSELGVVQLVRNLVKVNGRILLSELVLSFIILCLMEVFVLYLALVKEYLDLPFVLFETYFVICILIKKAIKAADLLIFENCVQQTFTCLNPQ